jgi:hypothetical protein
MRTGGGSVIRSFFELAGLSVNEADDKRACNLAKQA